MTATIVDAIAPASDAAVCDGVDHGAPSATKPLRVLHVVNGEHFSGAERVQSHLGRCLPSLGVTADFASVKPGAFCRHLRDAGGRYGASHELPMRSRIDITAAWRLSRLVEMHEYDLIHAHTPRTAMIAAIAAGRTGRPWVYHVHSPASRDSARRWINQLNAWIEKRSLKNVSHLICVSRSLRDDCIAAGHDPGRVTVVHNGVPAVAPRRKFDPVVGGRWTLGMIALNRPRKGLEILLEALAMVRHNGHDVTLRCIGPFETDAYQSHVQARVSDLGVGEAVTFEGFTDDVPAALAHMDAMVLPSLYGEGLPMVVLESMAAGTPVIATRVEGTPEAVTHAAEGLLAEPQNAASLADAIESLVAGRHEWSTMARRAQKRHADAFSDQAMAAGTAEVYRRLRPR